MAQLESSLQKNIQKICRQHNVLSCKVDSSTSRGFPDLTLILPNGVVLFVELKTLTGKTSPLQDRMIGKIKENKGNVYVIRTEQGFTEMLAQYLTIK